MADDSLDLMADDASTNDGRVTVWAINENTRAVRALAEQQRIANLIALAQLKAPTLREVSDPAARAWDTLFGPVPNAAISGHVKWLPRPDIAAALGVEP